MWNNTVYHCVGCNLGTEIFLKNMKHQKKGDLKLKFEVSPYTLYWGFKKIPFTLYTFVLFKMLLNGAKFIQTLTPGFKNHMRNLGNFRQAVESPKSLNSMGYFFYRENTFYKLKHMQGIYPILLSAACVKTHQMSLCHFWNHKSFFTTQLLCIFLAQT